MNVLKGSYLKLVNQSCTQASYRMNQQGQQVRRIEILERSLVFFSLCLTCSRLRDSGGKSFSKKKRETRAGAGVPPPPPPFPVVRVVFSLIFIPTILSESPAQAALIQSFIPNCVVVLFILIFYQPNYIRVHMFYYCHYTYF